jgi:tetratricopeptide (TPR) repeat protein
MANELVIDFNRKTAMGYSYRDIQENLVKAQTGQITGAMRENSNREIAATIASAGMVAESVRRMETGITTAIDGQTKVLSSTLEAGFGRVTNELGRMSAEMNLGFARTEAAIDRLSDDICQRLDKIANILETPRGTAARELYNNAFANCRKGFYTEALPDVQKAVELLSADYLSWFLEGRIYAFGAGEFSNVIDLDKAIAAYANAAKYVSPDAEKSEEAKCLAAEIRFYLGLAQYARSQELFGTGNHAESNALLSTARDSFLRSYQYSNLMLEARYYAARCKALLGDTPGALADLEAVIKGDARYCVKAEMESDFDAIRGDYHRLIEKMRVELYGEAAPVYKEITEAYNLAKQEGLTQYFEKTVQIAQDSPADSNRRRITSSSVVRSAGGIIIPDRASAGLNKSLSYPETIPLFEQCISAGFDKSLPYLDMRVRIPPYPALLNVLKKSMQVFQTGANNDGSITIVKYTGADTQIVIPASIGGKPVRAIGEKAFEQKQLTSVVIPGSVKTIGNNAFAINKLTSVVIPNGVITIGDGAFVNNQLTNVVIPNSVITIENSAFAGNHLTSVEIPGSVTYLSGFNINQLTSVAIPGSVKTIGDGAFFGNKLTNVVIPDSVTTIGEAAFANNQLKDITIGAIVNVGKWDEKSRFDSCYNGGGKKAGKYVLENGEWYNAKKESRKTNRWITIGALLGLVPLIGGFVMGHWFIGILIGIATAFVGAFVFRWVRGWGILVLALVGGGIALGIHLDHPFIGGIVGVIAGIKVFGMALEK